MTDKKEQKSGVQELRDQMKEAFKGKVLVLGRNQYLYFLTDPPSRAFDRSPTKEMSPVVDLKPSQRFQEPPNVDALSSECLLSLWRGLQRKRIVLVQAHKDPKEQDRLVNEAYSISRPKPVRIEEKAEAGKKMVENDFVVASFRPHAIEILKNKDVDSIKKQIKGMANLDNLKCMHAIESLGENRQDLIEFIEDRIVSIREAQEKMALQI